MVESVEPGRHAFGIDADPILGITGTSGEGDRDGLAGEVVLEAGDDGLRREGLTAEQAGQERGLRESPRLRAPGGWGWFHGFNSGLGVQGEVGIGKTR